MTNSFGTLILYGKNRGGGLGEQILPFTSGTINSVYFDLFQRLGVVYVLDFDRPLPWPDADRAMEEKIDFTQPVTGGPIDLGFDYFYGYLCWELRV